jgi:hypothetical protein
MTCIGKYISQGVVRMTRHADVHLLATLALCLITSACSLLISVDKDQCTRDADCARLGLAGTCRQGLCESVGSSAAPVTASLQWCGDDQVCDEQPGETCFKAQCTPAAAVAPFVCAPAMKSPDMTVTFVVHVQEFVSQEPPRNLTVRACRGNDVSCGNPVAQFNDIAETGDVMLLLPFGFEGFLELRSEALPGIYNFAQPLVTNARAKTIQLIAGSTLELLNSFGTHIVDPAAGLVVLEAFDCMGRAVGGIHFEADKPGGLLFVMIDSLPNVQSPLTVRDSSHDRALGGFLNAAAGTTLFSARIGLDGPVMSSFNANVRAGTVTYVDLHP